MIRRRGTVTLRVRYRSFAHLWWSAGYWMHAVFAAFYAGVLGYGAVHGLAWWGWVVFPVALGFAVWAMAVQSRARWRVAAAAMANADERIERLTGLLHRLDAALATAEDEALPALWAEYARTEQMLALDRATKIRIRNRRGELAIEVVR